MDAERYEKGLETRKSVLSAEHVERTFSQTDDFTAPLQELITEICWGQNWADPALDRPRRSILTLGILAALGRFGEFETHVRAGIRKGLSREELQATLPHIALYCGLPVGE